MTLNQKIVQCRIEMLLDAVDLPYYGNFLMCISSFNERHDIKTCSVNVTSRGMQFNYNPKFLDGLTQKEVNFVVLHELYHLLWGHPKRTLLGYFDYKLANIAQDMVINQFIIDNITRHFIDIPLHPDGKIMALFPPKEYDGPLVFEFLYEFLEKEKDKWLDNKVKMAGESDESGSQPSEGKSDKSKENCSSKKSEGEGNGKKAENEQSEDGSSGQPSLSDIFENLDENEGQYMDDHIDDTISNDLRDQIINDVHSKLESRGLKKGSAVKVIENLKKRNKDYISYIKRAITSEFLGGKKYKTITKPNRRGFEELKGKKKVKTKITVLLDTSGSMRGHFEVTLSYIYQNDIEMDLIEADTEVKWIKRIKDKKKLNSLKIKGLGGTILQPAVDLISEKFNTNSLLILTDGYCDKLDVSNIKGNILIISVGKEVPISKSNGKVKQLMIK